MANKSFFKVNISLRQPTQNQIEIVRRRTLVNLSKGRNKAKLDAKTVEAMMRIVSGRYSDLLSTLDNEQRRIEHKLDTRYAHGIKAAKTILIKIEQDIRKLEALGYDQTTSGIDYERTVSRLRELTEDEVRK